ncbi:MAG: hypothetical protein PHX61_07280 [Alphaproteobacteria bacterium]|nr:hypothetical protein [Alphaproteobacteria bacterium]
MTSKRQNMGIGTIFTLAHIASGSKMELFPALLIHFMQTCSSTPMNGPEQKLQDNPGKLRKTSGRPLSR